MNISTGIGESGFDRDPTFLGRSRSSNVSRVEEDTRLSQTTARGSDRGLRRLQAGDHQAREVARPAPRGRVDGSPAGRPGRFMDVVDEYLKEE